MNERTKNKVSLVPRVQKHRRKRPVRPRVRRRQCPSDGTDIIRLIYRQRRNLTAEREILMTMYDNFALTSSQVEHVGCGLRGLRGDCNK